MHEYNTSKNQVVIKEYGRNVQKIVEYVTCIKDKAERNKLVKPLIELMKQLNPSVKESQDYFHKLWDQLYMMSNFNLDVESKYDMPKKSIIYKKPIKMEYNVNDIHYKHYGKNIELLINHVCSIENTEERTKAIKQVGNLMKTFYMNYNKDNIEDELILKHIKEISGNKLNIDIKKDGYQNFFTVQNRSRSRKTRDSRNTRNTRNTRRTSDTRRK